MRVHWVNSARLDRAEIIDYIAVENPQAAMKMDRLFSDAAKRLSSFPFLGRVGAVSGTRELVPHESYRLIYEVDETTQAVWIMALVHTALQWPPVREGG